MPAVWRSKADWLLDHEPPTAMRNFGLAGRAMASPGGGHARPSLSGDGFFRLALRSRTGESDTPDPRRLHSLRRAEIGAERRRCLEQLARLWIASPPDARLPGLFAKSCKPCVDGRG